MKTTRVPFIAFAACGLSVAVALSTCSGASDSTNSPPSGAVLSFTVSAGTIAGSGTSWTFDAGTVPRYTTETVTFTVKNSGDTDFSVNGGITSSNPDFTTDASIPFKVAAGSSRSFVGRLTPTSPAEESGTLTLTPTSGDAVVINLKGTPDDSFQVLDQYFIQITNTTPPFGTGGCLYPITIQNNSGATITLTGSPPDYVTSSSPSDIWVQYQPASTTISPGGSETFQVEGLYVGYPPTMNQSVFTIHLKSSANTTAEFTFSFTMYDNSNGC